MVTVSPKIIITDNNGARELEGQELTDFLKQQAIDIADSNALKDAIKAKAKAKSALLEKLGITEDEAKLLLA
jgi:hypothetical protein